MMLYACQMATKTIPWALVEQLLRERKRSRDWFEKTLDVRPNTVSNWKDRGVPKNRAADIARALDTTADYLLQNPQAAKDAPQTLIHAIHPDDPAPPDTVLVKQSKVYFSAGPGHEASYELIEESEPAAYQLSWFQKERINPDKVRRFRVTGDSQEPFLYDGDSVLVNLAETNIIDGKLYAVRYGNDLRIKFLSRRIDGTLVLRSANPSYKDEEVPPEIAEEHISIIGRVRDKSGRGGL